MYLLFFPQFWENFSLCFFYLKFIDVEFRQPFDDECEKWPNNVDNIAALENLFSVAIILNSVSYTKQYVLSIW